MPHFKPCLVPAAAALAFLLAAPAAANCTSSTSGVAFGTYNTMSASTQTGTGAVTVTCDSSGNGTVVLSLGAGGSGSYVNRRLTSGANILTYNLYTSISVSAPVFGNGSGGTATVTFQGSNKTTVTTVYGRIPGSQNVRAGSYADTVIATITF